MDIREKLVELLRNAKAAMKSENLSCDIARNMFVVDFMMDNGVTVQEWISVDDRLPERPPDRADEQGRSWFTPDIDCIVYDGKSVFAANYCSQNKCFWYADTLHPLKNITHWMEMPHPPKGE